LNPPPFRDFNQFWGKGEGEDKRWENGEREREREREGKIDNKRKRKKAALRQPGDLVVAVG
jgi:hypothetical protein